MAVQINIITPDMSRQESDVLSGRTITALSKSSAALEALRIDRLEEATLLHREALALRLQEYPESSIQVGVTYNGLGEALLRAGRLDEAEEFLHKALVVRERDSSAIDAAATRENVGALREAQGRFGEAREVRLRGAKKAHILCSNKHVSGKKTL
ncbi:hypothetical protein F4825DRAFT_443674 [Nemania diffusa]|nr:hypothetical protein F4825DRAFT_443674 [Nemania diffusa]